MPNLHETVMGRTLIEGTIPALVKELKTLNQNLAPKRYERDIATTRSISHYLAEGYAPVLVFRDSGEDFIIVEREVRDEV